MAVISDINPNSLGALQPIRAPQVPISIPNPLSVAPFFQAQQLMQNDRRLDQQDIAMALQVKQMDFAQSQLLFQQTKELLDMGDLALDDLYKQHTSRQSQGSGQGSAGLQFGLDPTYAGHRKVLEKANAQIGDFQTKIANAARGALNGGDSKAINQLLVDTKTGLSQARMSLQTDKEYMKYAIQQQKFNKFMDRTAEAQKQGLSVDWREVQRVKGMYDAFANGEDLTNQQQGVLERSLSDAFLQDITFDKDQGYKAFAAITKAATTGQKSAGYNANIEGAPGYVAAEVYETFDDPQLVMNDIIAAAGADADILKMFKAATGLNPADAKEEFARWVGVQAKPYIQDGGTRVTEVGRSIYDPTEVLKAKAYAENAQGGGSAATSGGGSTGVFSDKTEDERAAGGYYQDLQDRGLEVTSGGRTGIAAVAKLKLKNPASVIEERNEETGEVEIYQVQVDKDTGQPIMEPDYDAKRKAIPGSDHVIKIGGPILTLGKRSSGIDAPQGGVQYQQGAVDTSVGKAVPTFQPRQLDTYRSRVASAYEKGEQNPIVRASENASQDSMSVDPQGARGRYQFYGVHQTGFLKSLGESDWKTAYTKLGPEEFAKKEDEYFNKNIRDKALTYTGQAFVKAGYSKDWEDWSYSDDRTGVFDPVNDYIASTANQSGDYQKIIDKAVKLYEETGQATEDSVVIAKEVLKSLYEARVDYIMNVPDSKKGPYKDKWHEIGVNRPYQDYIAALDQINRLSGADPQELQGTESFVTHTSDPIDAVGAPKATPTSAPVPAKPDRVQARLLSGGDFSPEELVTELQAMGEAVPGSEVGNPFGQFGPTTFPQIGKLNTEIQETQDVISGLDTEYSVKNKLREEKNEPLLDKTQDAAYKRATAKLDKLQSDQSKLANEFAPQAKDLLIERKFPEEARQSYDLYAEAIVDTLLSATDEIDLEAISDLKGSITESTVDGSEILIKETGKKAVRIPKTQLGSWVQQHARRSAFANTDPIDLRKSRIEAVQKPAAPTTTPAKKTGTGIDW